MRTPIIVVNLKAYPEALGPKALALAKVCAEVMEKTGASIAIAPAAPDLARVAHETRIPVLAQHVDAIEDGIAACDWAAARGKRVRLGVW